MEIGEKRLIEDDYYGYYIVLERIKPFSLGNFEAKAIKRVPGIRFSFEAVPSHILSYGKTELDAIEECKKKIDSLLSKD